MKTMIKILGSVILMLTAVSTYAQKIDEQRMQRDIEVAENVLGTLLRQQFDKQKMFFPLEVKGNYQPGYGITFRLPADFTTPIVFSFDGMDSRDFVFETPQGPRQYSYSYHFNDGEEDDDIMEAEQARIDAENDRIQNERERIQDERERMEEERDRIVEEHKRIEKEQARTQKHQQKVVKDKQRKQTNVDVDARPDVIIINDKMKNTADRKIQRKRVNMDSVRNENNNKMIAAAKDFLADYGDLISQLKPEERIIITNQGDQPRMWVGKLMNAPNRTHLSIEATKGDITQFKQGKLNRDQLLSKIKVVNTETVEAVEPDLELLSSIFDRLYQPDLARTYFTENRLYYERLKDYGVVYYMQVFSSNQNEDLFSMPSLKLQDIDQKTRDEKVKALYPDFENELKENILEYGRTVKSLKDNELLVFNVKLTRCKGCGIPSTLEVSVKGSVLKEYNSGKVDKNSAMSKLTVKKGADQ